MKLNFVFFGTPEFAAIVLEKLIAAGYVPAAVVCNPDEPIDRKQILTPPPTRVLAQKYNIPVFQPQKLRGNLEFLEQFKNLKPDLAIVAAFGKILPKEILDIPSRGFINVHGSLLPHYRGASPIQTAILNGEKETGVTIMEVDEEMDNGPTLANSQWPIADSDTYESLSQKLAVLGAELLIKILPDYISGKIKPVLQEHEKPTYTKIIKKENGKIDWTKGAVEIERMVRAYYPWPTAWTIWRIKNLELRIKVLEAEVLENNENYKTGEVFLTSKNELAVKCGNGNLLIKKLQLEGGKILTAKEFLNGHRDCIRSVLD